MRPRGLSEAEVLQRAIVKKDSSSSGHPERMSRMTKASSFFLRERVPDAGLTSLPTCTGPASLSEASALTLDHCAGPVFLHIHPKSLLQESFLYVSI